MLRSGGRQFVFLRPLAVPRRTPILTEFGDTITLDRFLGRVVLLNFWATWCAPCIAEMPALDRLQATHGGDNFAVVAISIDRAGLFAVRPFFRKLDLRHLAVYLDPDARTAYDDAANPKGAAFALYAMPITYLIDRKGRAVGYFPGRVDWSSAEYRNFVEYYINNG